MPSIQQDELPSFPASNTGWPWTREAGKRPDPGGNWPRISIIIPSLNQAQFLEEAVRSVLLQDYPDLDLIIMDGGSEDGSLEIIQRYQSWLSCWESKPDEGQSQAINKGLKRSTGSIVAWLNSDDYYYPWALLEAAKSFLTHPDWLAVAGYCNQVDEDNQTIHTRPAVDFSPERIIRGGKIPGQPAVFLKRAAYQALGNVREDLNFVMDWEYWLRVGLAYSDKVGTINSILAAERIWSGRKTLAASGTASAQERRKVLRGVFSRPDLPEDLQKLKEQAFSETYWREGKSLLINRQTAAARRVFWKAYRLYPDWKLIPRLMKYLAGTWIGYRLSRKLTRTLPRKLRNFWRSSKDDDW